MLWRLMASSCDVAVVDFGCSDLLSMLTSSSAVLSWPKLGSFIAAVFLGLPRGLGSPAAAFRFFEVLAEVSTGH